MLSCKQDATSSISNQCINRKIPKRMPEMFMLKSEGGTVKAEIRMSGGPDVTSEMCIT